MTVHLGPLVAIERQLLVSFRLLFRPPHLLGRFKELIGQIALLS